MFRSQSKPCSPRRALVTRSTRRGIAAVEFAVVVPFFILLVLGMIEVGRGIMVQQILTNAAREGAREAILDGATTTEVQTVVTTYLTGSSIPGATATVSPNPQTANARDAITVTVSVPVNNVTWMLSSRYFPSAGTFSTSATMLKEAE